MIHRIIFLLLLLLVFKLLQLKTLHVVIQQDFSTSHWDIQTFTS